VLDLGNAEAIGRAVEQERFKNAERAASAASFNSALHRISARRLIGLLARLSRGPKPVSLRRWATEAESRTIT
jgi:hypothetical protein